MPDYEEDNAYPNAGLPIEPPSRQRARDKEKGEVLQALPKLREVVDRFNDRLAHYQSVDAIDDNLMTKPDEFMHNVAANKVIVQILCDELNWLEGLIDEHTR